MKKNFLTLGIRFFIPTLLVIVGLCELFGIYLFQLQKNDNINLWSVFINILYGMVISTVYLLYQNKKTGGWVFNFPRLILLFLPLLLVGLYFINLKRLILIDTMGMSYLNSTLFNYIEHLPEHLIYVFIGFLLPYLLSKKNTGELKQRKKWIVYACFSAIVTLLLFMICFVTGIFLKTAIENQKFIYYTFESFVFFINIVFGIILGGLVFLIKNMKGIKFKFNYGRFFKLVLPFMILGLIPFVFICISYHMNFKFPYDQTNYKILAFFRQANFFQSFQMMSGFMLVQCFLKGYNA